MIFEKHANLKYKYGNRHFWCRGYYVDTVGKNTKRSWHLSVQRVTLGGEKSNNHLYENIHKIFPEAKINNVYASTEAGTLFAAKGDCFQIPAAIRDKFAVVEDELLIHKSLLGKSDSFSFDGDYYHSGDLIEWVDKEEGFFKF